jgi:hypothetical protein
VGSLYLQAIALFEIHPNETFFAVDAPSIPEKSSHSLGTIFAELSMRLDERLPFIACRVGRKRARVVRELSKAVNCESFNTYTCNAGQIAKSLRDCANGIQTPGVLWYSSSPFL